MHQSTHFASEMFTSSLHNLVESAFDVKLRVLGLGMLQLDGHFLASVNVNSCK